MPRLYLIQTGQTTWEVEERFESSNGSPLTDAGLAKAKATGEALAGEAVTAIYASGADPERQTAAVLTCEMKVKVHIQADLHDLDYGLWQGLTAGEVKRRQPKLHRQWLESPASVSSPGGETIHEAQQRLLGALTAILKRQKTGHVGIVVRPRPAALLRCAFTQVALDNLWNVVDYSFTWCTVDIEPDALKDLAQTH